MVETKRTVQQFLAGSGWYTTPAPDASISFLAAGEYNENWRIQHEGRDEVLRINHGSQLRLVDQIGYEYAVLRAVAPSGVTPRPLRVKSTPKYLSGGTLLMEFLPGRALNYATDLEAAGATLAAVHTTSVPVSSPLLRQPDPVAAVAAESLRLITCHRDHPMQDVRSRLLRYHEDISRLGEKMASIFADEAQVIANTEVNMNNFLVHDGVARLVDWEKAVITSRYQDLGHFLAPTTTLWKSDTLLDADDRRRFLNAYYTALKQSTEDTTRLPDKENLYELTDVMMRTVLLRGLAWCFMAWREYASGERAVMHECTRRTIEKYLAEVEWFLR